MLLFLTACSAVEGTDSQATMQSVNADYATRIAEIPDLAQQEATLAWATVVAARTEAARIRNVNDQLLATVAAVSPPTPSVIQQGGPPSSAPQSAAASGQGYTGDNILLTGVGTNIRQSDGCLTQPSSTFSTNVEAIYAGLEAFNITAGLPILAEWYQANNLVYQFEWIVDRSYEQLCIWFSITQADVIFQPGNWSVQMYISGQQINGPINFTFEDM